MSTDFFSHTFSELSAADLYQILRLRTEVFVLEQNCAYQDLDGLDQQTLHLYRKVDSETIVAYARILPPEQCGHDHCSIGRVVVNTDYRKQQLGQALMQFAINTAKQHFPEFPIKISAQTYLTHFYQNLGFVNTGKFYLEDDIPHQEMIYRH